MGLAVLEKRMDRNGFVGLARQAHYWVQAADTASDLLRRRRAQAFAGLRARGMSYAEIGAVVGLTGSRIQQILTSNRH
jgi:DNA-directed RNA polymerase specialized sigma24 family protein